MSKNIRSYIHRQAQQGHGIGSLFRSKMDIAVQQKCNKTTNVAFLKVHKAGSTTVMNIFIRFAMKHNLNLVLPRRTFGHGFNYLGYGKPLNKSDIIPLPSNESYNILCNHVVYSKESFDSVMPVGSEYIAVVREPLSQFVSASSYYGFTTYLRNQYMMKNSSESEILSRYLIEDYQKADLRPVYVYNRQSFDFGLPAHYFHNTKAINSYLKKLYSEFKFVMLMEYFDESLVLLKRILCWDMRDILYVPINVRKRKEKVNLSRTAQKNFIKFNYADFQLYEFFKQKFLQIVKEQPSGLREEVSLYRKIRSRTARFCYSRQSGNLSFGPTTWNKPFNITRNHCFNMTMNEIPLMQRVMHIAHNRYHQWETWNNNKL